MDNLDHGNRDRAIVIGEGDGRGGGGGEGEAGGDGDGRFIPNSRSSMVQ